MEEKFILLNLNEKKTKDIAIVMNNETARKILDYLTDKEKISPSELSKKLDIPLNTILHALKLLEKEGFITRVDHAWSEKGKKVFLYSLAKKMILIIPKGYDWKESLKKILPIVLVGTLISIGIKIYNLNQTTTIATPVVEKSLALDLATREVTTTSQFVLPQQIWLYVLAITFGIVLIILITDLWRKRK